MSARRDRALVLQRHPWSESSLVVHLLTRSCGRVHCLARGAYRPTSRFYCALDLFDTLEVEWNQPATRELGDLRAARIVRRRHGLAGDLARFRAAGLVLELSDHAARFGPADPELFALAERALDGLAGGARSADVERVAFELLYLEHLGVTPSLATCAQCGGPAPAAPATGGRPAFSAAAGGRLCAACATAARARGLRVGTLPVAVLDDARALASGAWPADAGPERIVRVRDFVERFLDYHLETRPRSNQAFLSVPNRNAPPAPEARRPVS